MGLIPHHVSSTTYRCYEDLLSNAVSDRFSELHLHSSLQLLGLGVEENHTFPILLQQTSWMVDGPRANFWTQHI